MGLLAIELPPFSDVSFLSALAAVSALLGQAVSYGSVVRRSGMTVARLPPMEVALSFVYHMVIAALAIGLLAMAEVVTTTSAAIALGFSSPRTIETFFGAVPQAPTVPGAGP